MFLQKKTTILSRSEYHTSVFLKSTKIYSTHRLKLAENLQTGLRTKLKNNQADCKRLIEAIRDHRKILVSGSAVRDMNGWLSTGQGCRRATVPNTQLSDGNSQSQSTVTASSVGADFDEE